MPRYRVTVYRAEIFEAENHNSAAAQALLALRGKPMDVEVVALVHIPEKWQDSEKGPKMLKASPYASNAFVLEP